MKQVFGEKTFLAKKKSFWITTGTTITTVTTFTTVNTVTTVTTVA